MRGLETGKIIPGLQRLAEIERNVRMRVQLKKDVAATQVDLNTWVVPSAGDLRKMKREIRYMGQPK